MKPGDVRQARVEGQLLLLLTPEWNDTLGNGWRLLDLEDGDVGWASENWLISSTKHWEFYA